jgi:hypothetical protein
MNDNLTRAEQVAAECAAELRRKIQHLTPAELAEMGWPDMTVEEIIEAEYYCRLEEAKASNRLPTAC